MTEWVPEVVVYHSPCPDGFTSYWLTYKYFAGEFTSMPANYGQPFDFAACRDKRVLFVDFSLPAADLARLAGEFGAQVVILDHHVSAQRALKDYLIPLHIRPERALVPGEPGIVAWFDMARSGASLTYDWLYPQNAGIRPRFVRMVEARDLWQPERMGEFASAVMPCAAYIRMFTKTIEQWDALYGDFEHRFEAIVLPVAYNIWQYHMALVYDVADKAEWTDIAGHRVPVVNTIYELASDVGHALLQRHPSAPFVGCYFVGLERSSGRQAKFYSIRSEDGREDVSLIASSLGGGGHRNAAGFREFVT